MWGLGLLLALSAIGRVVIGGVAMAAALGAYGQGERSGAWFLIGVGAVSAAYLVWFALRGHRALQSTGRGKEPTPEGTRATRVVLGYAAFTVAVWVVQYVSG